MGIENLNLLQPETWPRCGHTWWAPYIHPDGHLSYREQICILERGHDGDHRSMSGVIQAPSKSGGGRGR